MNNLCSTKLKNNNPLVLPALNNQKPNKDEYEKKTTLANDKMIKKIFKNDTKLQFSDSIVT